MSQSVRQAPETEAVPRQPVQWDRKSAPVKVLWGRVAALAATIIAAYLLGRVTAPDGVPAESLVRAETELAAAKQRVTELETRLAETTSPESARTVPAPAEQGAEEPTSAAPEDRRDETDAGDAPATGAGIPPDEGAEAPGSRPNSAETYVVKEGDSLNTIAREFYGDASLVGLIAEANNITARGQIRVGQKLDLPPKP